MGETAARDRTPTLPCCRFCGNTARGGRPASASTVRQEESKQDCKRGLLGKGPAPSDSPREAPRAHDGSTDRHRTSNESCCSLSPAERRGS
eukprot:7391813-Prymnesium_polylepis.3